MIKILSSKQKATCSIKWFILKLGANEVWYSSRINSWWPSFYSSILITFFVLKTWYYCLCWRYQIEICSSADNLCRAGSVNTCDWLNSNWLAVNVCELMQTNIKATNLLSDNTSFVFNFVTIRKLSICEYLIFLWPQGNLLLATPMNYVKDWASIHC